MISNVYELPDLDTLILNKYITVRKHPTEDLYIYNYTAKTQYDNLWNETTMTCRGLIADGEGKVVSRPFKKFFNLEQVESLPNEPFEVWEKMDGSLGVSYWVNGEPRLASRGSFESEQAIKGTEMLHGQYRDSIGVLSPAYTYLFEIIYPENRIVVDYGQTRQLVLLAVIDTYSGKDFSGLDYYSIAKRFTSPWYVPVKTLEQLSLIKRSNFEGFVIHFKGGLRVKVKTEEYVRLHRLLTGINERMILQDYLMTGKPIDELIERVPDEFYQWIKSVENKFKTEYRLIEVCAKEKFEELKGSASRKEFAQAAIPTGYSNVLFRMLDGQDYSETIWKMIKPDVKSFKIDSDGLTYPNK